MQNGYVSKNFGLPPGGQLLLASLMLYQQSTGFSGVGIKEAIPELPKILCQTVLQWKRGIQRTGLLNG